MTAEQIEEKMTALVESHVQKMDDISREGIARSQELMDQSLASIKRRTGIKNAMLDKALATLGINDPDGESDGKPI